MLEIKLEFKDGKSFLSIQKIDEDRKELPKIIASRPRPDPEMYWCYL